MPLFLS